MRVTKQTSSKKVSSSRGAFQTFAWLFHWVANLLLRSQKAGPFLSPRLMKKLEPTLHMKKRKSHSHADIPTIQPFNSELQDKIKRGIGTSTIKDEFTFPSSPERKVAKKNSERWIKDRGTSVQERYGKNKKDFEGWYIYSTRKESPSKNIYFASQAEKTRGCR